MSLTNIIQCIEGAENDLVCMAPHPQAQNIVAAGSIDDNLYIYDLNEGIILAKIQDFQDTVTQVQWISPSQLLACSLDGSLRLYQYEMAEYPAPLLVSQSLNQTSLCSFKVQKHLVFCQSEDSQFYVVSFEEPTNPQVMGCLYVEALCDFVQLTKSTVLLIGKTIVFYDVLTGEQNQCRLENSAMSEVNPTTTLYDSVRQLLFIGFENGVCEVYQVQQQTKRLSKIQSLTGLTVAGVNALREHTIFGNKYYYVGTNDALYVYEANFTLRNCVKFEAQGVSVFSVLVKDLTSGSAIVQKATLTQEMSAALSAAPAGTPLGEITRHQEQIQASNCLLVCGLTDGDVGVFDALSLSKICTFDALPQEDETIKPVLALGVVPQGLLVGGDKFLYLYSADFDSMGREQRELEEVSLSEPDVQDIE